MKISTIDGYQFLALVPLLGIMAAPAALAQPITPANDGTGTAVNRNGDRFDITGGSLSGDGANLFHSFEQFNLNKNQTANFISTPELNNILGRIIGGDPSLINGLIQVTGGNPNLILMNPAGIIFGPHASLNIPASFTVTTATGIGFSNHNSWFNSIGNNDYQNLIGSPNRYRFDLAQTGSIVNQGNLQLEPGQNLTLLAGNVVNTGELASAGGQITVAAVEGENLVRISQPGHLLNLEVSPLTTEGRLLSQNQQIKPLSLPELLTTGQAENTVTNLEVNERGQVVLKSGSIDVSNNTAQGRGGEVNILGSSVEIINSSINADGNNGGGNIFIGGDFRGNNRLPASQETYINSNSNLSANSPDNGSGGQIIIWSDGTTRFEGNISAIGGQNSGDGGFVEVSGKEELSVSGFIDVSAANGEMGTILLDPKNLTIDELATDFVTDLTDELLAEDNNADVTISAENLGELRGEIILQADNDITVNQTIETRESVSIKAGRSINLNADINTAAGNGNINLLGNDDNANLANRSSGAASINQRANTTLNAGSGNINISLGNLGEVGEINLANLTTTGQVLINANGGNIGTVSPNSLITGGNAIFQTQGSGAVGLSDSPLRIDVDNLEAVAGSGGAFFEATTPLTVGGANRNLTGISTSGGGDIRLNAEGKITVTEDISTAVSNGPAGNISLETTRGGIDATGASINSSSESGRGGNINLSAPGNIATSNVDSSSNGNAPGGNITVSADGNIDTTGGTIDSSSFNGNGGNIDFTTGGDIRTGELTSASGEMTESDVDIDSLLGDENSGLLGGIDLGVVSSSNSEGGNGNGGTITLNAEGNINTAGANVSTFSIGGNGGDVSFTAGGNLNLNDVISNSQKENGGTVNLSAGSLITANSIETYSNGRGAAGDINIETTSEGTGQTPALALEGNLLAYSQEGKGGDINITTGGDLNFGNIDSYSLGNNRGGNITIDSGGNIDASGSLRAYSSAGNGGNVNLRAAGDIQIALGEFQTEAIITNSRKAKNDGNGGNIVLESSNGNINVTAGSLNSSSINGKGGNVNLTAAGNIDTADINARTFNAEGRGGGNISLESTGGSVNTTGGTLNAESQNDGGDIRIVAQGDINTGILESFSSGSGTGGDIVLTSNGGAINAEGNLNASGTVGGNISLDASGNVTTADLNSSGSRRGGEINITSATGAVNTRRGSLDSSGENGIGGDIGITAEGNVITGEITAYGLRQGGSVTITSNSSDVNTTSEPDVSSEGTPGEVTVNASSGSISLGNFDNVTVEDGGEDNLFEENGDADATADADSINRRRGDVSLEAYNDITINEAIASDTISNLEIKAGRSINVNADIDTSGGNGNIALQANVPGDNARRREAGPGNITMTPGTTISAGRGNISLELGGGGETNPVGDITLGTLRSQGAIAVNARGGNILRAADNTIIQANSATFQTTSSGAIGSATEPLRLRVENLEATAGSGGAFFNSPNSGLTIGGASDLLDGISTEGGGDIEVTAKGDIAVTESLLTAVTSGEAGNIVLNSIEGAVDTSRTALDSKADAGDGGDISITAAGDVTTGNISSTSGNDGSGGNVTITTSDGSINTTAGDIASSSQSGNGGEISLLAGTLATDFVTDLTDGLSEGGSPRETRDSHSTGNITTGNLSSRSDSDGSGGRISLQTSEGAIDTTGGEIKSSSQSGSGGEINLVAEGNITAANLNSISSGAGDGGSITLESNSGVINTTAGILQSFSVDGNGGNIELDASGNIDIGQLNASAKTGNGGDLRVSSGGNIVTTGPNSTNTSLFSNSNDGDGGSISLKAAGNITASEIRTEAEGDNSNIGSGGSVDIEAGGSVRIRDVIYSYGLDQSGDVNIQSETGSISTRTIRTIASNGTSGNVTLNTFSGQGDVRTADITSEGGEAAGKIEIVAPDGSIRTEDLQSSSEGGEAGGIDLQAGEDIDTGDQTVNSGEGDSNINNQAGGNIATGDQTATADNGNASINNDAGGNIATGNQTATANNGNASINNEAEGNITGGNQTATANNGNASINNEAGGNVNLRDQIAVATGGDASINNEAGGNVNLRDQIAVATGGDASINNEAGGNINARDQVAIATDGNASINNEAGGDIAIDTQTTFADGGNATINNDAGGDLTVGVQNAVANGGVESITNNAGGNLNVPSLAEPPGINVPVEQTSPLSAPPVINNSSPVVPTLPTSPVINNSPAVVQSLPTSPVVNNSPSVVQSLPTDPVINNPPSVVQSLPTSPVINNSPSVVQNLPVSPVANNPSALEQPSNLSASPGGTTEDLTQAVQSQDIASDITNPSPSQSTENYRNNSRSSSQLPTANSQLRGLSVVNSSPLTVATASPTLAALESDRTQEFADYLGEDIARQFVSTKSARDVLADIAAKTGNQSAVLYVTANPEALQLVLYTSSGEAILKTVPEANREKLLEVVEQFRETIVNPRYHRANRYLPLARQLYAWMVAPIAEELEAANIDTLLFSMGSGLRGLPVAALHDGEEFLVQKYSLSLIPSISLMDTRYQSLDSSRVLAMGASEFTSLNPLPAVPVELTTIAGELWRGNSFLNQEFTVDNLVKQRQGYPYEIIHLATHAEFQPGAPGNSYIQLWNDKLEVDRVRQLGWNEPTVELLVLSACRTAVGDANAELGFAGLAVAAGVKSAMASLWYVSDEGTLALMTEFYTHLNNAAIKSEALRQAQLAMIEGKVAIEGGELRGSGTRGAVALPPELLGTEGANLSHPYYWSGFTMIGSPW